MIRVAVPVRGADCIEDNGLIKEEVDWLPSPRGVRIASALREHFAALGKRCRPREGCGLHPKLFGEKWKDDSVAVPARGADCIYSMASNEDFTVELPSPRGVRIASAKGYESV